MPEEIQSFTDGMIYQAIAGGIGSTGMPGFERTLKTDEIWEVVALVRHFPALSPEEKQALTDATPATPGPRAKAPARARTLGADGAHHISITNFKFDPPDLELKVGEAVVWTNTDFVAHTATANDKSFDTGRLEAGASKRIVISKAGSSTYFCQYHRAMTGSLTAR